MFLLKKQYHSLKIRWTLFNLLSIPIEGTLENKEIDEIKLSLKESQEKIWNINTWYTK